MQGAGFRVQGAGSRDPGLPRFRGGLVFKAHSNLQVHALAFHGSETPPGLPALYAGGTFTLANGEQVIISSRPLLNLLISTEPSDQAPPPDIDNL